MKVYLKESGIPNSGQGLFAAEDIEANSLIVEYLGDIVSPNETLKDSRSNLYFDDGYILHSHKDNLASFANDCVEAPVKSRKLIGSLKRNESFYKRFNGFKVNAEIDLDQKNHKAFLYSKFPIKKDEEIFCHYGFLYWFNHEAINFGFDFEKEIERKGLPEDIFKYRAFHLYVKEFYPGSTTLDVLKTEEGWSISINFEDGKKLLLNMPKISNLFGDFKIQ